MSMKSFCNVLGFLVFVVICYNASAATQTATMAVALNVPVTCSVSANPLAFGNFTGTSVGKTNFLNITCTNGAPYTIDLDAGAGAGATTSTRLLTNSSNSSYTLSYSLYTSSARTTVWAVGGRSGIGAGTSQAVTVFSTMFANSNPYIGNYSDTIGVTVNY